MSNEPDISSLREALDGVDAEIVRLLGRRLGLVAEIGHEKERAGAPVRDAARERDVLSRAEALARDAGVPVPLARRLFAELFAAAVARQSPPARAAERALVVAYQGVPYAYAHLAAEKHFPGARFVGVATFADAVRAVVAGEADRAVLPIENTTAGSINQTYDLLRESDVAIVGEEVWHVDHCLAAPREVPLQSLRCVLSHPQALEQCSIFLATLGGCEVRSVLNTAEAMKAVAENRDATAAAIGSPEAAAAYGLCVLAGGIANQPENYTRFVVLAREPAAVDPRVPCKTSVVFSTRHEKGALLACLRVLADHDLNMTKLESRPRPHHPWEYLFYVDFEGNAAGEQVAHALDALRAQALYTKLLGSYPTRARADEPAAVAATAGDVAAHCSPAAALAPVPAPSKAAASKHYRLVTRDHRAEDTNVRVGDLLVGNGGFVVMAGPCSVESRDQIFAAAKAVRDAGARILRGGVFKPRTSPYAFQGLGWEGLDLLCEAGRAFGLPVVTEVLAPEQVRGIAERADMLQIGARNMQNFPLLREVGKVMRPVLLKRGLSSTIDEWLGAAEYVLAQGNGQVILCERGIRTFETATRNTLDLSAVLVLRERTHLPVVVDPSHGTGRRAYVTPMARAARAVGAHGLLVEVHPDPDRALSDGDQSLDFGEFAVLMRGLAT